MSDHDDAPDPTDAEPGPKEGADDATMADAGLTGTPARSATPVGQGDGPGVGADVDVTTSDPDRDEDDEHQE